MTAKDRWTVTVSCPKCPNKGIGKLWQEDGWSFSNGDQSTHVSEVPKGFRAEKTKDGLIDFYCDCGEKADES